MQICAVTHTDLMPNRKKVGGKRHMFCVPLRPNDESIIRKRKMIKMGVFPIKMMEMRPKI